MTPLLFHITPLTLNKTISYKGVMYICNFVSVHMGEGSVRIVRIVRCWQCEDGVREVAAGNKHMECIAGEEAVTANLGGAGWSFYLIKNCADPHLNPHLNPHLTLPHLTSLAGLTLTLLTLTLTLFSTLTSQGEEKKLASQ